MKLKVLAFVPDSLQSPTGGMGEQFRFLRQKLEDRVDYYICGYPETNNIPNYKSVSSILPSKHAFLRTIYGQSIYFQKALEFNKDFDLVHAFDWSTFVAGSLYAKHFNKPLVCTMQLSLQSLNKDGIYFCGDYSSFDGKAINDMQVEFERYGFEKADRIVHVSDFYMNQFLEYKDKSVVIPNGIDPEIWVQKNKPTLPGDNKVKACYIGRAAAMKGIDMLLDTTIPDDIDFYFVVSEKNAEQHLYKSILAKCNNRNIFHINGLYGQQKIDFLFSMNAVVMPSIHEPFGIVALEALASKNILITTNVGGISEITKNTKFIKIYNNQGIEGALNEVKNLECDHRNLIAEQNQQLAFKFDWDSSANLLFNLYRNLVYVYGLNINC
jgi:glycosyltransferase involved in cell wall biosynthesis